jgi:hypothetical protein
MIPHPSAIANVRVSERQALVRESIRNGSIPIFPTVHHLSILPTNALPLFLDACNFAITRLQMSTSTLIGSVQIWAFRGRLSQARGRRPLAVKSNRAVSLRNRTVFPGYILLL